MNLVKTSWNPIKKSLPHIGGMFYNQTASKRFGVSPNEDTEGGGLVFWVQSMMWRRTYGPLIQGRSEERVFSGRRVSANGKPWEIPNPKATGIHGTASRFGFQDEADPLWWKCRLKMPSSTVWTCSRMIGIGTIGARFWNTVWTMDFWKRATVIEWNFISCGRSRCDAVVGYP